MATNWRRSLKDDEGQATVELALLAPIIMLIMFFVIELSIMGLTGRQAQTAAQVAAVETASFMESEGTYNADELKTSVLSRYPMVKSADIEIKIEDTPDKTYMHHQYDPVSNGFTETEHKVSKKEITAHLTMTAPYLTPVGAVVSLLGGSDTYDSYNVSGTFTAPYDTTPNTWS